ncbi:MAG: serine/threonine-protein kinase, partial [Planctomycetota bacterium]
MSANDAAQFEAWLAEFVERRERGEVLAVEDFAREKGGSRELLAALRALAATEALFPTGPLDLPARIGPYRVQGEIGRGGMGRVLAVIDPARPGAPLALKLLHVSLGAEPRALERFRREGQALERLQHPGIVRVHACGVLDGRPYLAMEHVEGASLATHVADARARVAAGTPAREALQLPGEGAPLERAVRLVARIARAMESAHREGVLHRDLNPRNVLVRSGGEPVVIDFGLVRAGDAPTMTGSGDLVGTPQYMAPEQARGEQVDERTDVFALGLILRELLTLAPPRVGEETLALVRSAGGRPLAPAALGGLPRALAHVVARATSFFPRWRYRGAAELAAELERWLEGEPVHARAPGVAQRLSELVLVRRRALAVTGALALALTVWSVARREPEAERVRRRRIDATTALTSAWLARDVAAGQRELARYRESETSPPFLAFFEGVLREELTPVGDEAAALALLAGERARRAGDARAALASFRTAWDLAPGYPFLVLLQGLAALEAGELEVARTHLEPAAFHFGRCARLHRALAELYERLALPADA